ncbi:NADP-dependent oxidoreductase [Streptomyces sp. NPDC002088]|uniref:NADP-dependent oxidoreductase n=1 Tax=Streptomyces sp. NPDC002088 TaxID=3154665 RepID=UPI00331F965A
MHAVRAHSRGGPEQLVYEVAPRPRPAPGEVLVAVRAASITSDELTWDATWTDRLDGTGKDRTPIIPSHEVSELGPGVTGVAVGDEVYGLIPFTRDGAAAEYVSVPVDVLAAKPAGLEHDKVAALPLTALTARQALVDHASVKAGQHVLIQGGAGGVGSFAVQIASLELCVCLWFTGFSGAAWPCAVPKPCSISWAVRSCSRASRRRLSR